MIHSIRIQRFRSIDDFRIDCGRLTTFIGMNDAGKSNVVRALNLFFNGQTDHDKPFNFEDDFNKFSEMPLKKAKEIIITVSFLLPKSYIHAGYPKTVSWQKSWRIDGEQAVKNPIRYTNKKPLRARSFIPTLLKRYNFTYIPAIKDPVFFADILGKLYDTLSKAGSGKLGTAGEEFNSTISGQVKEFLDSLGDELKDDFKISLPDNLRSIFENLKISNKNEIPLERRGDGIKIRHIPELLSFFAVSDVMTHAVDPHHIWAFEEPENNLEFSAAINMAERLEIILKENKKTQIFLTTHSPVFYKMELDEKLGETKKWFISKDENSAQAGKTHSNYISIKEGDDLDTSMGFMPLIAARIEPFKEQIKALQIESEELKRTIDINKKIIFVEGKTDKAVIERAINIFPELKHLKSNIQIMCCDNGGKNSVINSLQAWQLNQQHNRPPQRGAGLIDVDLDQQDDALPLFNKNSVIFNSNYAKLFYVEARNSTVIDIHRKNYRVPKDLESLYSDDFWNLANRKGWLEPIEDIARLPKKVLLNKTFSNDINIYEGLTDEKKLRVQHTFSNEGKIESVKYIKKAGSEEVYLILKYLKDQLEEIFIWLNR